MSATHLKTSGIEKGASEFSLIYWSAGDACIFKVDWVADTVKGTYSEQCASHLNEMPLSLFVFKISKCDKCILRTTYF